MGETITGADICLLITVSIIVIANIALACCIGLVLPKHMKEDGWFYVGDSEKMSHETKIGFCKCEASTKSAPANEGVRKKTPVDFIHSENPSNLSTEAANMEGTEELLDVSVETTTLVEGVQDGSVSQNESETIQHPNELGIITMTTSTEISVEKIPGKKSTREISVVQTDLNIEHNITVITNMSTESAVSLIEPIFIKGDARGGIIPLGDLTDWQNNNKTGATPITKAPSKLTETSFITPHTKKMIFQKDSLTQSTEKTNADSTHISGSSFLVNIESTSSSGTDNGESAVLPPSALKSESDSNNTSTDIPAFSVGNIGFKAETGVETSSTIPTDTTKSLGGDHTLETSETIIRGSVQARN